MVLARLKPQRSLPSHDVNAPVLITEAQIVTSANLVAGYIREQRQKYQPLAREMSKVLRGRVEGFFPDAILANTGLCVLATDRIEDPPFYAYLTKLGITNLPSFAHMAAVTFLDVIVTYEKLTRTLLFHELVHAVQYHHLGVNKFALNYVRGFIEGGSYESIPLERCARELERRFTADPSAVFSVDAEVGGWLAQDRS